MKLKNTLLALSAGAMLVAPVAAQAGTKASASTGKIATLSGAGARQSTDVKKKQKAEPGLIVVGALAVGAAGYGLYTAVDDDTSNGS